MKSIGRLLKRADFLRVHKQGKKWVAGGVIIQALANEHGVTRFGVTVSKKLDKSAVGRNRMRRRLKAAAYDVLPVHARQGIDFVLIGRHETPDRPYETICTDLKWCLEKIGLLKQQDAP